MTLYRLFPATGRCSASKGIVEFATRLLCFLFFFRLSTRLFFVRFFLLLFAGEIPRGLSKLSALQELDLSHNQLTGKRRVSMHIF